jgi:hypothetical protein
VILSWSPEFDQLVLVAGDERAGHTGSTNAALAVRAGRQADVAPERALRADDEWDRWLRAHGGTDDGR